MKKIDKIEKMLQKYMRNYITNSRGSVKIYESSEIFT
mgnify:CR=1 FL=1